MSTASESSVAGDVGTAAVAASSADSPRALLLSLVQEALTPLVDDLQRRFDLSPPPDHDWLFTLEHRRDGRFLCHAPMKLAALLTRAVPSLGGSAAAVSIEELADRFVAAIHALLRSRPSVDTSSIACSASNGLIAISVARPYDPPPSASPSVLPPSLVTFPSFPTSSPSMPHPLPPTFPSFVLPSIGVLRSVFREKFGTPRQPAVVPSSLGCVELHAHVPCDALSGLSEYSHVWLLFMFHLNPASATLHSKVRPPRLAGEKTGLFATRSPHRPSPVGLSVVRVERVEGRRVWVSGLDVVDGSPVIDIKPYHPADRVDGATWPSWVGDGSAGPGVVEAPEPRMAVDVAEAVQERIRAWGDAGRLEWYSDGEAAVRAVRECIAADPRTLNAKRKHRDRYGVAREDDGGEAEDGGGQGSGEVIYGVSVDRLDVAFRVLWLPGTKGGEEGEEREVAEAFHVELFEDGQERPKMRTREWYGRMREIRAQLVDYKESRCSIK